MRITSRIFKVRWVGVASYNCYVSTTGMGGAVSSRDLIHCDFLHR